MDAGTSPDPLAALGALIAAGGGGGSGGAYVPDTATVNGELLKNNPVLTARKIGAVPARHIIQSGQEFDEVSTNVLFEGETRARTYRAHDGYEIFDIPALKYRPLAVTDLVGGGLQEDMILRVDLARGNDATGDGSYGKPYGTPYRALQDIPKNLNGHDATIYVDSTDQDPILIEPDIVVENFPNGNIILEFGEIYWDEMFSLYVKGANVVLRMNAGSYPNANCGIEHIEVGKNGNVTSETDLYALRVGGDYFDPAIRLKDNGEFLCYGEVAADGQYCLLMCDGQARFFIRAMNVQGVTNYGFLVGFNGGGGYGAYVEMAGYAPRQVADGGLVNAAGELLS